MVSARTKDRKEARDAERASQEVRIAWHKLNIMTSLQLAEIEDTASEATLLSEILSQGLATKDDIERIKELRKPENSQRHLFDKMEAFAKYVEYVPHDWFSEDAPDELDFSDSKTYQYLRTNRFSELYRLLLYGQEQQEAAAKN